MRGGLLGADEQVAATGAAMLDKIEARAYTDYREFRADLNAWLDSVAGRTRSAPDIDATFAAWREALEWLRGDYWTQFRFNADTELAAMSD